MRRSLFRLLILVSLTSVALPATAQLPPENLGRWTEPFELPEVAIHSIVVPTGEVLMFVWPSSKRGSEAWLFDPDTGDTVDVSLGYKRDLFCSGHSLLPDGRVLVTGGTVYGAEGEVGVAKTDIFDPFTRRWTRGPRMEFKRWYPTNVSLPNGKTLIFSGHQRPKRIIEQVEIFDPEDGTLRTLPSAANKRLGIYPVLHLLPDGRLLKTLNEREGYFFDPASGSWGVGPKLTSPRGRWTGNSVLLTGSDRILALGGGGHHDPQRTAEILELGEPEEQWVPVASMKRARRHPTSVVLPDGKVLVVGGNRHRAYGRPVMTPELFNPDDGTWRDMAPHRAPRGYHSTAVLLPDGRVLLAGQDHGPLGDTAEIYEPPYLSAGPRPEIRSAPTTARYGHSFDLTVSGAPARVTLMRPPSVTHGVNFDQRLVELTFEVSDGRVTAQAPANPELAPPGYYMVFVLNGFGVPSEAAWIRLV